MLVCWCDKKKEKRTQPLSSHLAKIKQRKTSVKSLILRHGKHKTISRASRTPANASTGLIKPCYAGPLLGIQNEKSSHGKSEPV